ncbi:MAG: protein-S-isoprenylcysteine O-methyltransferase Ste14 [Gammaproteobacteria bacterium]|jgi:protein-S-isoprenylcysteine O-methyltransferase Ste14
MQRRPNDELILTGVLSPWTSYFVVEMSSLELKIPPPVILAFCGALAWVAAKFVATPFDVRGMPTTIIAIFLVALAIALATHAILAFRRAETTIDPTKPDDSSSLVTHGVFRFTRNPMYLSLLLLLTGWVVYLGSVVAIAALFLFVAYVNRLQIRAEERILTAKFGEAYLAYCAEVRRWI